MITDRVANTIRVNAPVSVEDALRHAIGRLVLMGGPNDLPAAVMLQDILQQRGMTEFAKDAGYGPDDLPGLIEIIVRG